VHMGTRIAYDMITSVELGMDMHRLHGESGKVYSCNALIVATGAKAKWLGMPSEEFYKGFGVSACATCDGPFFRSKTVVVVGG
ncbi:FAD-dependent oxidoreductase, partial [Ochrobactrum sp. SFR4]|uniref:NAD(P)/FAD-dependent oxidoreductase n=1 Tax=Ochrobactrum sp. SFR4 TaxID=2717368 RepID=UPI003369F822